MPRWILIALGLLAAVGGASVAAAADATGFDGRWGVTLVCLKAPDGAQPFTFVFTAEVKDATLHGEHGQAGQPGWLSLDGRIQSDGSADLEARGITGSPDYNLGRTPPGVTYRHAVTAHFDAARGSGTWVTPRTCDFTFKKQ